MTAPSNTPFQGGGLDPDDPTHVVRATDEELYQEVQTGKLLCVFNARQMGKTTLQNSTVPRLRQAGFACIPIYLGATGSLTEEQWYTKIAYELVKVLQLGDRQEFIRTWWKERSSLAPVQRLEEFLETVLLVRVHQPVVVFFDEIDIVRSLSFSTDDFFALLRSCYQQRALKPDYRRLTFVLIGVATPSDLIRDKRRPPFNIGQAIHLEGFKPDEVAPLEQTLVGKVEDPHQVLCEILSWTGGQPFLTQKLRHLVETGQFIPKGQEADAVAWLVRSRMIDNWESNDEPEHLRTIRDRLLSNEQQKGRLLGLYQQILQKGAIEADSSEAQTELCLSGLVVRQNETLRVYNRLYAAVFDPAWVEQELSRLRPYAEQLQRWLDSGETDESQLLQGQELDEQLAWAKGKNLADDDNRFFAASQEYARVEAEQKMQQIQAEEQRSTQRLAKTQRRTKRILAAGAIGLAILTAALGVVVNKSVKDYENARLATDWERRSGEALKQFETSQVGALLTAMRVAREVRDGHFAANNHNLSISQTLRTFLPKMQQLNEFNFFRNAPLQQVSFSPDGQKIAVVSDRKIQLLNRSGQRLPFFNSSYVSRMSFSPDGQTIAFDGSDTIRVCDLSGKVVTEWKYKPLLLEIKFSPDGKRIATGDYDGNVQLWDLTGKKLAEFKVAEQFKYSMKIRFSSDSQTIITSRNLPTSTQSKEKLIVQSWNLSGKLLAELDLSKYSDYVGFTAFSPDGQRIAVTSSMSISIFDWSGNLMSSFPLPGDSYQKYPTAISFSANGKQIITVQANGAVLVQDTSGKVLKTLTRQPDEAAVFMDLSSDDQQLAIANLKSSIVQLWKIAEPPSVETKISLKEIKRMRFSPDGRRIALIKEDELKLLNLSEQNFSSIKQKGIRDAKFSPDSQQITTEAEQASEKGISISGVKVWNTSGQQIAELENVYLKNVNSIFDIQKNVSSSKSQRGASQSCKSSQKSSCPLR